MSLDQIFSLSFLLVAPFWFLMIFLPHWRWTKTIASSPWIAAPAAVLYLALVAPRFGPIFTAVSNPTLPVIAGLLGEPAGATIGWAHFLAFDLFVGRWAYLDSRERGISAWLMGPILYLTIMLGPIGFLLYLAVRAVDQRRRAAAPV